MIIFRGNQKKNTDFQFTFEKLRNFVTSFLISLRWFFFTDSMCSLSLSLDSSKKLASKRKLICCVRRGILANEYFENVPASPTHKHTYTQHQAAYFSCRTKNCKCCFELKFMSWVSVVCVVAHSLATCHLFIYHRRSLRRTEWVNVYIKRRKRLN